MIEKYHIRTDLAMEQKERFESDDVEVQGVILEQRENPELELKITKVKIETENGAKTMGKPVGTYLTLEAEKMTELEESYQNELAREFSGYVKKILPDLEEKSVLVVGLGNQEVTPDALGPEVIKHLEITRHILKEYGKYMPKEEKGCAVSAIVPGVMAQTGMETLEIIKGIVEETRPDYVIAIDALAARNCRRLNRTIQIADTGIHPGSGVGNYRIGLTKKNLGVPVIGIGVPTVVDAATIVNDTLEEFIDSLEESENLYAAIQELIAPSLHGMFVTPKDIDETILRLSSLLARGLNHLFHEEKEAVPKA